jgi:hypothetical protein
MRSATQANTQNHKPHDSRLSGCGFLAGGTGSCIIIAGFYSATVIPCVYEETGELEMVARRPSAKEYLPAEVLD